MSKYVVLGLLLLSPLLCYAGDNSNETISYGLSFDFLVTDVGDFFDVEEGENYEVLGSLYEEKYRFALYINHPYNYFADSNAGYYFNYSYRSIDIDKQDITPNGGSFTVADLGTAVSGYNIYAYASLFYNFGDKRIVSHNNSFFKAGVGIGAGYLKADGDIILTEVPGQPRLNFDIADIGMVYQLFAEYRHGPWIFRAEAVGTEVKHDGKYFVHAMVPIQLGYSFAF